MEISEHIIDIEPEFDHIITKVMPLTFLAAEAYLKHYKKVPESISEDIKNIFAKFNPVKPDELVERLQEALIDQHEKKIDECVKVLKEEYDHFRYDCKNKKLMYKPRCLSVIPLCPCTVFQPKDDLDWRGRNLKLYIKSITPEYTHSLFEKKWDKAIEQGSVRSFSKCCTLNCALYIVVIGGLGAMSHFLR